MITFYSGSSGVEIKAPNKELLFLAKEIAGGNSVLTCLTDNVDAFPYESLLKKIIIKSKEGSLVDVEVSSNDLYISGSKKNLNKFAEAIMNFAAHLNLGEHTHIEYFENHFFLSDKALPLVISRS